MSLKQQIWYSKDADLFNDLAKYQAAIKANQFPEMIPEWTETVNLIEHEIEQRQLLASTVPRWLPTILDEVPF